MSGFELYFGHLNDSNPAICHFGIIKQNMKTYCLVCKKNTDNVNSIITKTKNGRLQLKSECSICGNL